MDGGEGQNSMAKQLTREIKRNANLRRVRAKIQSSSRDLEDNFHEEAVANSCSLTPNPGDDAAELQDQNSDASVCASLPPILTPPDSVSLRNSPTVVTTFVTRQESEVTPIAHTAHDDASTQKDFESSLLMSYLDYAFPVLFPFYRPSVLEGGRSWLLTIALQHPAFYHNIIGLAAYFYCAVPVAPGPEHDACVVKAQTELQKQMEKAVQGVQNSLRDVNERGVQHALSHSIRLLGNIVQLVNFEVAFASSDNWQMHMSAAADLFDQTLEHHGKGRRDSSMISNLLDKLRCNVPSNCSVLSAEQAAFRFFAATFLYQDIIASTTLERAPKLFSRYSNLLYDPERPAVPDLLKLDEFVGCQTWVLVAIAEISCLDERKKKSTRKRDLDIMVLVKDAQVVQERLHDGIRRLDEIAADPPVQRAENPFRPLETILAKSKIINGCPTPKMAESNLISRIWAHAAHVYLIVVLSGWQPAHDQLRGHVAQALDLLGAIDNPSWLRTLAWPFCITGCLATQDQESSFRDIASASGGLAMFGTLRDALNIMETVWSQRHQHNADTWDIATCLRILGHNVLLV